MNPDLLQIFKQRKTESIKSVAILIDPDDVDFDNLPNLVAVCHASKVHYFFVGGSLISSANLEKTVKTLKGLTNIPIVLFPGNHSHISNDADGLLLLSLVSGRNAEFLIGQHVVAAPVLKRSKLSILSTAYILIDGGTETTVSYISNTKPIPNNKPEIAACTALAAEMIGMKLTYLDAGSGAKTPVSKHLIKAVAEAVDLPLIVGGGLRNIEAVESAFAHGADVVVIGNAIEENPDFVLELATLKTKSVLQEK